MPMMRQADFARGRDAAAADQSGDDAPGELDAPAGAPSGPREEQQRAAGISDADGSRAEVGERGDPAIDAEPGMLRNDVRRRAAADQRHARRDAPRVIGHALDGENLVRGLADGAFRRQAAIALGFVLSLGLFALTPDKAVESTFTWLAVGDLKVSFGLLLDPLSKLMLLVVTGVGLMIHIYSRGYLHGDRSFSRYFASLSLFTFSMLGIVLANNLFMMFVFWELVGVSSYLLIGFWFEKNSAADAAKKAFLTNRIGDFGFILGVFLIWKTFGTVKFAEVFARIPHITETNPEVFTTICLLLFLGAMGKSAQFPLHVWLPLAHPAAPSHVSALMGGVMTKVAIYGIVRVLFDLLAAQQQWWWRRQ